MYPIPGIADDLPSHAIPLFPHARTHFFEAGIYTLIGLVMLCTLARTLLHKARRAGWFALLFALVCGAAIDLAIGGQWFQHESMIYHLYGMRVAGFGWEFLYLYIIAWGAALMLSYRPVFQKSPWNTIRRSPAIETMRPVDPAGMRTDRA